MPPFDAAILVGILNNLAEKTKTGFLPGSVAITSTGIDTENYVIYDDKHPEKEEGYCKYKVFFDGITSLWNPDEEGTNYSNYCYGENFHPMFKGIEIRVIISPDCDPYISVYTDDPADMRTITIENGRWYVS